MMKQLHLTLVLLLALLCAGCGAVSESAPPEEPNPPQETEASQENPQTSETASDPADQVLLTLLTTVDGSRELRLEAIGREFLTDYGTATYGVRKVRVWEGETLIQTVLAQEAIETEWGTDTALDEEFLTYTECWAIEELMDTPDMNFDGSGDLDLFGWIPNNTIPHYYWLWDSGAGQYRYAFCLQGVELDPEAGEVISEYSDSAASYCWDHYQYDEAGHLTLVRQDVETYTQDPPLRETYLMQNGQLTLAE